MIKSNRCNFFSLSYLEMCSKTNFPTSLQKFYMYRYMLASLSKMTYVEVYIHFSQIRCCFIQSFDYVTHYMIIKKYLTPQRWIWIGIDHTWWLTALLYQAMVYWSELIPGWSVIICTNYKSTCFKIWRGKYQTNYGKLMSNDCCGVFDRCLPENVKNWFLWSWSIVHIFDFLETDGINDSYVCTYLLKKTPKNHGIIHQGSINMQMSLIFIL